MSTATTRGTLEIGSLLEKLEHSLALAAQYQHGVEEAPAAVLWTDGESQWQALLPVLRRRLPQLLTLGAFDPAIRQGPAIWVRAVVADELDEPAIPEGLTPIVYLPGVSRHELRAGEECPLFLQPLVELQFSGTVWTQRNGKDWTVEAFLMSEDGLGLDVARDARTRQSLSAALARLAETPLSYLLGKRLDADHFDRLMVGDQPRDLLTWMSDPAAARASWESGRWQAFRSQCKRDYSFDPETDGDLVAGERFGLRKEKPWRALWDRFCESPGLYPGIPDLLTRSKPSGQLVFDKDAWPDENEAAEDALRATLLAVGSVSGDTARKRLLAAEAEHAARRQWVWARLGRSPLARALEPLGILARGTASQLGGESSKEVASTYADSGYRIDLAVLDALAAVRSSADFRAVQEAVRAVYLPWADASARLLQDLFKRQPITTTPAESLVEATPGGCLLFADGLRFDLATRLAALCEQRGLLVSSSHRWAALPTVTATAKPAVSPISPALTGGELPEDFGPSLREDGVALTTDRFRRALTQLGYQILGSDEPVGPREPKDRAWCEFGQIDERGHELGIDLVRQLPDELERMAEHIVALLEAGWRSVRIVTDHGWLLVPGGLPKHDLPQYLLISRWSRCAAIKGSSKVTVPRFGWFWNQHSEFATAPGIACFSAGNDYAHGGVSLQECLIPDLLIQPRRDKPTSQVRITGVQWQRLRCKVETEHGSPAYTGDLRTKPSDPTSSIAASSRTLGVDGRVDLLVEDPDREGASVVVVIFDESGRVVAKEPTIVGGEQ